jgi:hypothetical protein
MRIDIPGKGPIEFEGIPLPDGAKHFDQASFFPLLKKPVQRWLLDLCYCWGRKREASSRFVLRACDTLESRIRGGRWLGFFTRRAAEPQEFTPDWLQAIESMRQAAQSRKVVRWTIRPLDGGIDCMLKQNINMIRCMERAQGESMFPPGFLDQLRTAPDGEKVQFLLRSTDAMSDET